MSPFYPVHGNTTLPEDPLTAARNGASDTVRVLIGSNKDETTLWSVGETDQEKLERTLAGYQAEEALVVYQRTRPEASSHDLLVAITTDHMFRIPAIRLAEARQGAAATYMYQFNWRSRALDGALSSHPLARNPLRLRQSRSSRGGFLFGARAIASRTGGYHAQSLV